MQLQGGSIYIAKVGPFLFGGGTRHYKDVDMVPHQTIGKYLYPVLILISLKDIEI